MYDSNTFVAPKCSRENVDTFLARKAIFESLLLELGCFKGTLLDVGCGNKPYEQVLLSSPSQLVNYIGLDIPSERYNEADIFWDGVDIPLGSNSVDCAIATEVFEHCPNPAKVTKEIARVLRNDGFFFFSVPFLWPLHDAPYDEYRYTPYSLHRILTDAGFKDIKLSANGGWDASLLQMFGLWAKRRPKSKYWHYVSSQIAKLLISNFEESSASAMGLKDQSMITGICGTCRK